MTPRPAPPVRGLGARGPMTLGFAALAALVLGFGTWSLGTEIAGAIVAPGLVEVEQNRQVVQHPDGGVVASISVSEAQAVAAGDLLITLDGALLTSELAIVEDQLYEALARQARLEAERDGAGQPRYPDDLLALAAERPTVAAQIDGQSRLFAARADTQARQAEQLARRLDQIAAQVTGIGAQIRAQETQLSLLAAELADKQALLAKGLTQSVTVSDLQRRIAGLEGTIGELSANRAVAEGRATEVDLEILRLGAARREEASTALRDLAPMILELAERRRALQERIQRLEIRAPVSGIVLGLQVTTPRAVLRPADPVLYLIPQDRPLVIVAKVSPLNVDEVFVGQAVNVTFGAFSARTTPTLTGRLVSISADALQDAQTGLSFFRAEVALDAGERDKLGDQVLLPGMPVQALIQTDARSPMSYLLKPFTDYFRAAFRET